MKEQEQFLNGLSTLLDKMQLLDRDTMQSQLNGFKPAEVHTIEFIGKHSHTNVTQISSAMYVTRGAVSKMTKRLMAKELIESYQISDNKKEIYFRLTTAGKRIFNIHESLNHQFEKRDESVFKQTSQADIDAVLSFISKYNQHLDVLIKDRQ
ncbi:MarR family transcriptional regulator [Paucilactobacillus suebicus]|uniref:MarR family transcriptional regulator n=1 Tax=Paucilactobacillus suebicus DSM 5007 = KCTC 3549 TaxID=1423807 RepID=A0A0R1W1E2_9LACO|nr:MarR family transcriptional regulator [Paucilactobacillus suebicus]KRM11688.1 MarR family transcriptional regulator [Paucilactobacillus suebicus DSM 5007 = KCTC 3549]